LSVTDIWMTSRLDVQATSGNEAGYVGHGVVLETPSGAEVARGESQLDDLTGLQGERGSRGLCEGLESRHHGAATRGSNASHDDADDEDGADRDQDDHRGRL
jgi:hypothetical protein